MRLVYLFMVRVFGWLVLLARSDTTARIEHRRVVAGLINDYRGAAQALVSGYERVSARQRVSLPTRLATRLRRSTTSPSARLTQAGAIPYTKRGIMNEWWRGDFKSESAGIALELYGKYFAETRR